MRKTLAWIFVIILGISMLTGCARSPSALESEIGSVLDSIHDAVPTLTPKSTLEPTPEPASEVEVDTAALEGELVEIKEYNEKVSATILVPDGWTYRFNPDKDMLFLKCNDGEFVFTFTSALLPVLDSHTVIKPKSIDGYEVRGRIEEDGTTRYVGDLGIGNYRIHIRSEDLDLESSEICAILDTIVITIN